MKFTLHPAGITGVLVCLGSEISEELGAQVAALGSALAALKLPGIVETVPAYASLLVRYDPLAVDYDTVCKGIRTAADRASASGSTAGKTVDIPVCYGGVYGEDLPFVASHAGLTPQEVISLHSGRTYRIYMLGFLPGFPYLGGLDERLHTPRLDTPRTKIPAGSVGIGGKQTGIYPVQSPGGWQLIGRTPLRLFSPGGTALPYAAGDRIRFVPISADEFESIARKEGTL